ncbi:transcriptional regulator, TetR family [Pseudarthrobacter phenanthrenivorans Sphe3]|uniref:Transcriptional regulator, TetR family n=1 Tax=Pseudarthrobacter phenanthrenivorans (strain DSM 18606 / JCM 16027 / LMG 23796 / Sphe3) TaxID=930171 RepID=F0M975_PSEPM|nr:TetR/AcrR family transcriptional regulator [Pseudarthrobacter phenanthrenivorans]ADX74929.1 transcriptional regulator, TetR family [Pseudarthrobacter phenanthrenivorans Sphe3]
MSFIPLRPGLGPDRSSERSDAARNRERLLTAARELIEECGAEGLTMDRLAEQAGVGKGTVFRRFGSRAGLMLTLLSESEAAFQARFLFGPPPLGPGAPGMDRLIAFGTERIAYVMEFGELVLAAEHASRGRYEAPAAALWHRHIEVLLRDAGFDSDPWLMASSLAATLDPERLLTLVRAHGVAPERLSASWQELVTRVVRGA